MQKAEISLQDVKNRYFLVTCYSDITYRDKETTIYY